ncbi:PstS family phosphate ABC transporter substrate-binding protein [Pampinifervens florentissimum]|uniref:PstS family phosphate ABC transporter substrate-binding protein n=1 Tax=Pampinifervens florentissimum TaxID=1632019 RepID=UPI0013B48546|nr:PstS family phosphate ABC transporter substrate-binding protein [Hydrogenobacter sp. T-8]QID34022.1 PstS family phosphate ABC transporter substrate-binding protein [Hydrogenobacter sp. T-8]
MRKRMLQSAVLSMGALALLSVPAKAQQIIKIDGSSTVYPITEGIAEEFQKAKRGAVKVTVGISGTGGGFKKFCRGETDISNASRPILAKEMEECRKNGIQYIELPVAYDGLAVVVNPRNNWATCMTVEQLREIWKPESQGKKFMWSDLDPKWPKQEIKLCGAGSDSGTFDYFTEAIVGKAKSSRGDYTASEDDNVLVQFAQRERGALCYFGLAYVEENKGKIKAIQIKNPKTGQCVAPTYQAVQNGTYQPLSRPLFIYVNAKAVRERPEVREFVEFYLKNAGKISKQVGYIALPDRAYKMAEERFNKRVLGTVFGGEPEVGLTIDELLKREAKQ